MKLLRTSYRNNKRIFLFLITIFLIAFIFGIIFYTKQEDLIKSNITDILKTFSNNLGKIHINYILIHIITLLVIFTLSLTIIGLVFTIFYFFYECMTLGFIIAMFTTNFGISGLIFAIIYIILVKIFFILILFYIYTLALKIDKRIIYNLLTKSNETINSIFKNSLKKLFVLSVILIISDVFIYFCGSKILQLCSFLLK